MISARASTPISAGRNEPARRTYAEDAIHRWYRIIMGFDWKLADNIIRMLDVGEEHVVVDPFCGAGTTLVQCKKRGIRAVGLDVNPVCTLATRVKTTWNLKPSTLEGLLECIVDRSNSTKYRVTMERSPALRYFHDSGMIERGWLSLHKARKVLALRAAIEATPMKVAYRDFFCVALISAVVSRIADIRFGPEVYCLQRPRRLPAVASFVDAAQTMIDEMEYARGLARDNALTSIHLSDSRVPESLRVAVPTGADFAITSPPYPNEHDYTRSTRLELVLLDHVHNVADLRRLKRGMIRCTTKGIYKDDGDAKHSSSYRSVCNIARELDERAEQYEDGFSRLYGRMVREYFGGMACHLQSLMGALKPGGRCAYVVRDTQALLGVYIDTPAILARIAASRKVGFAIEDIIEWKQVKGTTGSRMLSEKILIFRRPPQ